MNKQLKDGHVIAAVEEERFTRRKFDDDFPHKAIQWCLDEACITSDQIERAMSYGTLKFELLDYAGRALKQVGGASAGIKKVQSVE